MNNIETAEKEQGGRKNKEVDVNVSFEVMSNGNPLDHYCIRYNKMYCTSTVA